MSAINSRVAITGTFCSLNKGDAAMRIALADELRKTLPGCHITMLTPYPELDCSAYRCDVILQCSRRKPRRVAGMIIRSLLWRVMHRVIGKRADRILDKELRVYRQSDLIVDLSGDGITEEYGARCLIAHVVPIILGELLKRPVFVCAQTIGPLYKTRSLCLWLLKHAHAVTAREQITLDYLTKLGVNHGRLSLTADMAFLTEPESPERAREIMAAEGVPLDKPIIGFSISRLPGHMLGSQVEGGSTCLEREFALILDRVAEMGLQPVFISHTTGPGDRRDDRIPASRVAELASSKSGVVVIKGDYSAEEIKAVIGQMDLFVGVRMHSCIGAMSMLVPTISIAYGPKAYGIMSLAGQQDWMMSIQEVTADKLVPLIEKMWREKASVRQSLEDNMTRVKSMARENMDIVTGLLRDSSIAN